MWDVLCTQDAADTLQIAARQELSLTSHANLQLLHHGPAGRPDIHPLHIPLNGVMSCVDVVGLTGNSSLEGDTGRCRIGRDIASSVVRLLQYCFT